MFAALKRALRVAVPRRVQQWVRVQRHRWRRWRAPDFGLLRRLRPISAQSGFDRGLPIDRYYTERFLRRYAADIRGHALEFGDDRYLRALGGERVTQRDILNKVPSPEATIVADLTLARDLPTGVFDCIVSTQALQSMYDVRAALGQLHRMLRPGGVLLATVPGIQRIVRHEAVDAWGDYWRFTTQSMRRLLQDAFPGGTVDVEAYGNVFVAAATLHGLAAEELRPHELTYSDPHYEVLIAVRAIKARHPADEHVSA